MHLRHETSLLSTPGQFGPKVSKTDDEELCFLKRFGFTNVTIHLTFDFVQIFAIEIDLFNSMILKRKFYNNRFWLPLFLIPKVQIFSEIKFSKNANY